jgi:hypothetical protein
MSANDPKRTLSTLRYFWDAAGVPGIGTPALKSTLVALLSLYGLLKLLLHRLEIE